MKHIDQEKIEALRPTVRQAFLSAVPYQHVVIDGFLRPDSYEAVLASLPSVRESERSSDYVFARNKFENPFFDKSAPVLAELRAELVGEIFTGFLQELYRKPVFVDPDFVGGGLHQGGEGSYLDMHADFSRHPLEREWVRELNILLYLNRDFQEAWGGHLEMVNAHDGNVGRVAPQGNRLVIMLTKGHTLHGYKPISFPPDRMRTSIAAYAYSVDNDFVAHPERSTLWHPKDASIAKRVVAKITPELVRIKRYLFGSSTARRATRKDRSD